MEQPSEADYLQGQSLRPENIAINREKERQRLLRVYEALPKSSHGSNFHERHPEILPEWVANIIENLHERLTARWEDGDSRTLLVGRIEGFGQWMVVVLLVDGTLLTAYPDRRMEARYGGRPWQNQE